MYERHYGHEYAKTQGKSTTDIAKMIREDIKTAKAEGLLPQQWSYSVRSDSFSGGSSIDVEVKDCPDAWQPCDGGVPGEPHRVCPNVWCSARNDPAYAHAATPHDVLTEEARAAEIALKRIHGAYNHDGSEIQVDYFDVNYYGHVQFEDARSANFRAEQKAKQDARKAANDGGKIVAKIAKPSRDRIVVHVVVEGTDGKQRLGCGAQMMRYTFYQKCELDTPVNCSRCAKREARQ